MKNLDLNTSPDLPASSGSVDGASGGSLGGASMADLQRGYSAVKSAHNPNDDCDCPECVAVVRWGNEGGGFLGRPHGFER